MGNTSQVLRASRPVRLLLFGAEAHSLGETVAAHDNLVRVEKDPDVVVCYGGDGTLLSAELRWPGIPKVPVRNSRRGHRCIPHPVADVLNGLAAGELVSNRYTKIEGEVLRDGQRLYSDKIVALNEFNVHMGLINSAVRFQLWLNGEAYDDGVELLGDGFVVSTPFGSRAYYAQITRGIFTKGIGIAFKSTNAHVNHLVLPEDTEYRVQITRGPAVLAFDSADEYLGLVEGDELVVRKHAQDAVILTCDMVKDLEQPV